MARRRQEHYLSLAMHMKCNLKCEHCMIESTMDSMEAYDNDRYEAVLAAQAANGHYRGLILTGAEITLRQDLPDLARRARAAGFDRLRIQTHAMRFASKRFCDSIIEAGVNEFFVSITSGDPATHDAITGTAGSFDKTIEGLTNLDEFSGVSLLTNTVITTRSYLHLAEVVDCTSHLQHLEQMEFWNYWPMAPDDPRDLIADNVEVGPHLRAAVRRAHELDREVVVQNFPECLLGDERRVLDNALAQSEIDDIYWIEFEKNRFGLCPHRFRCTSKECWGLTAAYVDKYGDQSEHLLPIKPHALRDARQG